MSEEPKMTDNKPANPDPFETVEPVGNRVLIRKDEKAIRPSAKFSKPKKQPRY